MQNKLHRKNRVTIPPTITMKNSEFSKWTRKLGEDPTVQKNAQIFVA